MPCPADVAEALRRIRRFAKRLLEPQLIDARFEFARASLRALAGGATWSMRSRPQRNYRRVRTTTTTATGKRAMSAR
jgi:hypothetical protein